MAVVVLATFALLLVALSYVQVVAGPRYRDDPRNARVALNRAGRERGGIIAAQGEVLAESVENPDDPRVFQRVYPEANAYGHTVGYSSLLFGDAGLEEAYGSVLTSGRNSTISAIIEVLSGGDLRAQGLQLTIDHDLQQEAIAALGDQRGAIVALDPRSGAVLAMVSHPDFDPNSLLGRNSEAGDTLAEDPDRPLLNRGIEELYPPGSTFKLVTAAAALESGAYSATSQFPDVLEQELPGTQSVIRNFDRRRCGDGGETVSLGTALERSCNTVFAQMGMELGAQALVEQAEAFGFNDEIPFDLDVVPSSIPEAGTFATDLPAVAQHALGQRDVRATPMQMALVAAAIANQGVITTPHLVQRTFNSEGDPVEITEPTGWRRAVSPATADTLTDLMERVVASGTGRRAAVPGVRVAGKTGTAETPTGPPHAWFVGFGPIDAGPDDRQIAVAVLVESGGDAGESGTGGTVAAPIAGRLIDAWVQPRS
jgi:peptidoglycan glycosyltransferase